MSGTKIVVGGGRGSYLCVGEAAVLGGGKAKDHRFHSVGERETKSEIKLLKTQGGSQEEKDGRVREKRRLKSFEMQTFQICRSCVKPTR